MDKLKKKINKKYTVWFIKNTLNAHAKTIYNLQLCVIHMKTNVCEL